MIKLAIVIRITLIIVIIKYKNWLTLFANIGK